MPKRKAKAYRRVGKYINSFKAVVKRTRRYLKGIDKNTRKAVSKTYIPSKQKLKTFKATWERFIR